MAKNLPQDDLNEPITRHMHQDYTSLRGDLTVSAALAWLRAHPPRGRVIYFYVVDSGGVLQGVVPTRRLVLSEPEARIADIMIRDPIKVPQAATVLDACGLFIMHRLLAFPVADDAGRLVGVVDIDVYTRVRDRLADLPPAFRWLRPLTRFLHIESSGGIVLMACTIAALVLANSPWAADFASFWQTEIGFAVGGFALKKSLLLWINDALMTLFFFVVGLEINREIVVGELSDWRKATLPIVAALGGMVVPAAVYLGLQWGTPTARGWGVPTATDIAFVVGFLVLLGPRVPHGLKVLLLSLAIVDDIGAILVIAVGYNQGMAFGPLALGLVGLLVVLFLRWAGIRQIWIYMVLGAFIWLGFLKSGVHPTVAGVALGLMTPARPWLAEQAPVDWLTGLLNQLRGARETGIPAIHEPVSVAERLEHALHPWVAFVIMPVFALANAGVALDVAELREPIAIAIIAGLVVGKPLGVVLFSLIALQLGWAKMPTGVDMKALIGAGCLAGIGFTMSLFIAGLAFDAIYLDEAKIGILVGSGLSAALGSLLLWWFLPTD